MQAIGIVFETVLLQPLASGLIVFYKIFGNNMGLAIVLFTIFLKIVLNPLTKPYMESMKKMKDVAPSLQKLKEKHKGDKVKLAQAQADLYKQNKINPAGGCLPYLLQIVILIAFFNVFSRTLYPNIDMVASFNKLVYAPLRFSEGQIINTKFLYLDVRAYDTICSKPDCPINLPFIPFTLPGPLLLTAAIIQFLSAKITSPLVKEEEKFAKKTKGEMDDMQVSMQKSMIYMFPLMTIFIGLKFPSGLALYWLLFSLLQAIQQVRSQGWGGLTPLIKRLGLLKSTA